MYDIKMIIKMALDKRVLLELYRVYRELKQDASFSIISYVKMMLGMTKGEKLVKHDGQYITSTFMPPLLSEAFITNIRAVDDMAQVFTKQIHAQRTAPISMYLCVTDKCPNNCVYCSSKDRQTQKELTTEQWVQTIEDLQEMNTAIIGITGGEPMVRKDIYEIVSAIDHRSVSILFTSGVNMTMERARKLKASGLFGLGISLDSADRTKHNANRGSDNAYDYALEAFRISRKAGLYTIAQTVITKDEVNERSLFKLFRLAKAYGAHEVKILEPMPSGNLLTKENQGQDMSRVFYDKRTRRKLIAIGHKANRTKGMPKVSTFAYTESKEKFGCGAGTQHSYISASGDLYPCDFVPMAFGNVTEDSIIGLWKKMNHVIGMPKIGCFAMRVNQEIYSKGQGKLPLDQKQSCEICFENRSTMMPDYYRHLQKS